MMDFNEDPGFGAVDRGLPHPVVTFFHVVFRLLAIIVYLFGASLASSFIGVFVSVVLLLSMDFWAVKNVTGRIMVGLRWWNYIDESGESKWVFECRNGDVAARLNRSEVRIFWIALAFAPAFWALFFLTALFSLNLRWLVLVVIGFTLTMSNLLGYLKCRFGSVDQQSMSGAANTLIRNQVMSNVISIFSFGRATSQQPSSSAGSNQTNI